MAPERAVALLEWPQTSELGVAVAVTKRHGGVSEGPFTSLNLGLHVGDDPARVVANRELAAGAFGVDLESMIFAEQVHGADSALVGGADRGRGTLTMDDALPRADILLTSEREITLVMLVADCVPLALVDAEAGVLAVVHAGWRGTTAGAVGRAIEAMTRHGARAERVVAFMGPAVHPDRYQVDAVVHRGLSEAIAPLELAAEVARPDGPHHWRVDLIAANRQQLVVAGVPMAQIFDSGTSTAMEDFFTDRAHRPCGRFALMARLLG